MFRSTISPSTYSRSGRYVVERYSLTETCVAAGIPLFYPPRLLLLNFIHVRSETPVIPLGGLGEFGMNSMAIRYGDDIIVIDAGMMFPDAELMGVDIVTPDFSYLEQNAQHVRGLVLTHGHEDHIGGVPFLLAQLNIPVYGTAFTLALVERRLEEHELLKSARLHTVKPGEHLQLGPFAIEFIHVTHSIVQCVALAITTPLGVDHPYRRFQGRSHAHR